MPNPVHTQTQANSLWVTFLNEPNLICLHTWLFNPNFCQHYSFVCTLLKSFKHCFLIPIKIIFLYTFKC